MVYFSGIAARITALPFDAPSRRCVGTELPLRLGYERSEDWVDGLSCCAITKGGGKADSRAQGSTPRCVLSS